MLSSELDKANGDHEEPTLYDSVRSRMKVKDEEIIALKVQNKTFRQLVNAASCPNCDGSGAYYDSHNQVCQCQWCDEAKKLLAETQQQSLNAHNKQVILDAVDSCNDGLTGYIFHFTLINYAEQEYGEGKS